MNECNKIGTGLETTLMVQCDKHGTPTANDKHKHDCVNYIQIYLSPICSNIPYMYPK